MAHLHSVYDTDNHFRIDPITKTIKNESNSKVKLMQGDHNSERFTFEIPRLVEGHDMSLCDKVIMHFDNIDAGTKEESKNYFISKDVQLSPEDEDTVIFSYLIERSATKYGGSLNFLIEFICTDSDGTTAYAWHTDIFTGITVGKGIHNTEIDVEENKDLLEQFKKEVLAEVDKRIASGSGAVTGEQVENAVKKYIDENGISTGSVARIGEVTLLADEWTGSNNLYSQVVNIDGVTENSQVDLTPSVEHLAIFYEKDLTFVTENENGIVTVYAIGQKPTNDYTIQVTITEVEYE